MNDRQIHEQIENDEKIYEKTLGRIAECICADNEIKIVLMSGGSCSGKTTTTKKLAQLITAGGRHTHTISLDDFYRNKEDSIYLPDGTKDIESINSLEIGLIKECLLNLIRGREAQVPRFNFLTQRRTDNYEQIVLDNTEVAIIEGLHALNPLLFEGFTGIESKMFKIYLNADDKNNGDPRFIRRLVRDYNYRGSDAESTYYQWDKVKHNELESIEEFRDTADIKINTYFPYEKAVLAGPAIEVLSQLQAESIHKPEAEALVRTLSEVTPIPVSYVPNNSLLQEFIKL
jgi:uridine kinase